jgi:GTP-binding protein HflX
VADILGQLGVDPKVPQFEVWNKLDQVPPDAREALKVQAQNRAGVFPISALTGEGVPALLAAISQAFDEAKIADELVLPYADGKGRARLHQAGVVVTETAGGDGYRLTVLWTPRQKAEWQAAQGMPRAAREAEQDL